MIITLTKELLPNLLSQLMDIDKNTIGEIWNEKNFHFETDLKWQLSSVVLEDNLVCGFLMASRKEEFAHVHRMGVRKDLRGRGYGRILMEGLVQKVIQSKLQGISLKVDPSNEAAILFYKKNGFFVAGNEKNNILMQKKIAHV